MWNNKNIKKGLYKLPVYFSHMHEEAKVWLVQAQRDLISAQNSYNSKDYYVTAFFSQQAVEKGLKALYIKSFKNIWKIHDLVLLAKEVKAPPEIIEKCAIITPAYFEVRYPESDELPADKVGAQKAQELLHLAQEVLTWIEKTI